MTVLIDSPKPALLIPPYRCSDWFNRINPIAKPGNKVSRKLLTKIRTPILNSINQLQNLHPNIHIWDPFPVLCDKPECSAYDKNGLPIYYDGDHLSGKGNRLLVPSFEKKICEIWGVEQN